MSTYAVAASNGATILEHDSTLPPGVWRLHANQPSMPSNPLWQHAIWCDEDRNIIIHSAYDNVFRHYDAALDSWSNKVPPTTAAPRRYFGGGSTGMSLHTHNGGWGILRFVGGVWIQGPPRPGALASMSDVFGIADDDIYAIGQHSGGGNGFIYHWDGVAWTNITSLGFTAYGGGGGISVVSPTEVYVSWTRGTIDKFDGVSATPVFTVTQGYAFGKAISIWAFAEDDIFVSGFTAGIKLQLMHWNGSSYTYEATASPSNESRLHGISPTEVYVDDYNAAGSFRGWDGTSPPWVVQTGAPLPAQVQGVYGVDTTPPPLPPTPPLDIPGSVFLKSIARKIIRVEFKKEVLVTPALTNVNNWSITPLTAGAADISVLSIQGFDSEQVEVPYVDLEISKGTEEATYQVVAENLRTSTELTLNLTAQFIVQSTKVDSIIESIPSLYSTHIGSNLRQILTAVGIGDEEIGGNTRPTETLIVVEEEEDMLPQLTYTGTSMITVDTPSGLPAPRIRFNTGAWYEPTLPATFNPATSGVGGLRAGLSEAADTWYYLYLVQGGVVGDTQTPADGGPSGYTAWRYIGAVRNDSGGDLRNFKQVGKWFEFPDATITELTVYEGGGQNPTQDAWFTFSTNTAPGTGTQRTLVDAIPVAVADSVDISGGLDSDTGDFGNLFIESGQVEYTPGVTGHSGEAFLVVEETQRNNNRTRVPLHNNDIKFLWDIFSGSNWDWEIVVRGYTDGFLG